MVESGSRVLKNLADCSGDVRKIVMDSGSLSAAVSCDRSEGFRSSAVEHGLTLVLNFVTEDGDEEAAKVGEVLLEAGRVAGGRFPEDGAIARYRRLIQVRSAEQRGVGNEGDGAKGGTFFRKFLS